MRWRVLFIVAVACFVAAPAVAQTTTPEKASAHLQNCCVTLKAGPAEGSGTIIQRLVEGEKTSFILTANHVVDNLRRTKKVTTPDGDEKTQISYDDAYVVQEWLDEKTGERVGETKVLARIFSVDEKRDIAALEVKAKGWKDATISFFQGTDIPSAGTAIIHCGSPGGQEMGAGSVLFGNVARIGCRITEFGPYPFDQLACPALGGSSGGMVVLQGGGPTCGQWIGMITLGLQGGDSFHWMVPVRIVRDWAKEVGCEWLLDSAGKTTREALSKIPLENAKAGFSKASASPTGPAVTPAVGEYFRPLRRIENLPRGVGVQSR